MNGTNDGLDAWVLMQWLSMVWFNFVVLVLPVTMALRVVKLWVLLCTTSVQG
jgi:hypothetical protein